MKKGILIFAFILYPFILIYAQQEKLLETKFPRNGSIWSLDWSPDGKYIACGNASGLLRIYDSESLDLRNILTGFKSTINGINWSPDGNKIVASGGNEDPKVIIWDLIKRERIILDVHTRQVRSVKWSPKGTYFASSSHDGTIRIWTPEGEFIKMFDGADGGCVGIDWFNEDKIAASCWDNTIRIYHILSEENLLIENGNHRRKAVLSIDWHPEGKLFATGDYGNPEDTINAVKIWTTEGVLQSEMTSHQNGIRALSWHKNGDSLATGGETIRLWNKQGSLLNVFEENTSPVWSLDWNPKGTKIATGHNDGKIRIWNINGQLLSLIDGHSAVLMSKAFSRDSTQIFLGFADGILRLINLTQLSNASIQAHSRSIRNIQLNQKETKVAMNCNDGTCSIWGIKDSSKLEKTASFGKEIYAEDISWSNDGQRVAFLHNDSMISVWSSNGQFQYSLKMENKINRISWEEDKPFGVWLEKENTKFSQNIYINKNNQLLELIPFNNNRFALIGPHNKIVYGNNNDFIKYTADQNGFSELHPITPLKH